MVTPGTTEDKRQEDGGSLRAVKWWWHGPA